MPRDRDLLVPSKPEPLVEHGDRGMLASAVAPKPPAEKPHRVLQAVGYQGGIGSFNERVQSVIDAHRAAKGFDPAPGLALDVARSQVPLEQIQHLFGFGSTIIRKANASLGGLDRTLVEDPAADLLKRYQQAVKDGTHQEFWKQHGDEIKQFQDEDPVFRDKFSRINMQAIGAAMGPGAPQAHSILGRTLTAALTGAGQITEGLILGPPTLVFAEGAAVKHSIEQRSARPLAHENVRMAKGVYHGVIADVKDPEARPGYLFLDVFGLVSAGAGTATRLGSAGGAVARGAGKEASRSLVERPRGGRIKMKKGEHTEDRLGSENMLVNAVQRLTNDRRNARMARRTEGYPAGALTVVRPLAARDRLEQLFEPLRHFRSDEAKLRREGEARRRVEMQLAMGPKRDLGRVAGWAPVANTVYGRLATKVRRGLTVGEQKAIQVITLDDPTPLQTWREFHQRMIAEGVGSPKDHQAHLAALDLAEKALENPSKRFKQALQLTYDVIGEQQRIKIEELGLSPELAERRVLMAGEVVRTGQRLGQMDIAEAPGSGVVRREPGTSSVYTLDREVRQTETVLRGEERRLQTLERQLAKPPKSGARKARPALEARVRRQRENVATWQEELDRTKARQVEEGPRMVPLTRQSPSSIYLPTQSKSKTPRRPSENQPFRPRDAGLGYGPPRNLPELHHQFTGESLRVGDFRIDATNLAGESYGRTVRLATIRNEHKNLWNMATENRKSPYDRPVRDVKDISPKLREVLNNLEDGLVTEKDASQIAPRDLEELHKFLYPGRQQKDGSWRMDEPIEGVRWIDPALVAKEHAPSATGLKVAGQVLNEPFRFATLFLRVAYILNAVGNAGMIVLHQGHHAPPNMARAVMARDLYGPRVSSMLDALAGETKSRSFTDNRVKLASTAIARGWSFVSDQFFRRSAVIHELKRLGYDIPLRKLTAEEQKNLESVLSNRASDKDRKNVVEAARRANKAMVEFDNLSWAEREYIKQFIFVYPWVSRSLVWSVRSIVEHPIKVDILTHIGADMEQEHPEIYKHVPDWFRKTGYIPVGFDAQGNPKVINATSVNSFTTLGQFMSTVQAGFLDGGTASQYNSTFDMLGPMAKYLVRGVTGKDDYGNPYPGPDWISAAKQVLLDLPQTAAYQRAGKAKTDVRAADVTNRRQLIQRLNSAMRNTVFSPGWLDGYGMLITGGLSPRSADKDSLIAKYWNEQTPEKRHNLEKTLIRKALVLQGDLLKTSVPTQVRDAVDISTEMEWRHKLQSQTLGRTPTELERTRSDIQLLSERNRIPAATAAELLKKSGKFQDPKDLNNFHSSLLDRYAGGKELQQWDSDVRFVASFTKPIMQARLVKLGSLSDQKTVTADQETLYEAGRQALTYRHKIRDLRDEAEALPHAARDVKLAELRAYVDSQDKPIRVKTPLYLVGKPGGLIERGNIDINNRPRVKNPDGSVSTVRSITIEDGGRQILIPTVVGGRVVSNDKAIAHYKQTGQHLGIFKSNADAEKYAVALHREQARNGGGGQIVAPSPIRLDWANMTEQARTDHVRSLAGRSWGSMSNFDKEVAGKKVPEKVSAAWALISQLKFDYKRDNYVSPTADQILAVVKQMDKNGYQGILQDYIFSAQPKIRRFEVLKPYTDMPPGVKSKFNFITTAAKQVVGALKSGDYPNGQLRQAWTKYVNETLKPWLSDPEQKSLALWLDPYGPDFLSSLVGR